MLALTRFIIKIRLVTIDTSVAAGISTLGEMFRAEDLVNSTLYNYINFVLIFGDVLIVVIREDT